MHRQLEALNQRLDVIDSHCREFSELARQKADLEDELRNMAYLKWVQNSNKAV